MLFQAITSLALLATSVLGVPLVLERQESFTCPSPTITTVSWYVDWQATTTTLAVTTITNTVSQLGSVRSTKYTTGTYTWTTWLTKISPSVTTYPATTTTILSSAPEITAAYMTITMDTTTLPGTPPESLCRTKTCTNSIYSYTETYTQELFYDTTWKYTTGHVSTVSTWTYKTKTKTTTVPGSVKYSTTVTSVITVTPIYFTIEYETATVYQTPAPTVCT